MNTPLPTILRRAILAIVFAVGALGLLAALVRVWPQFRGVVLYCAGRAATCGLAAAVRAPGLTTALEAAIRRAPLSSRRVATDGGRFEKWETEQGFFWILAGSGPEFLRIVLPEQAVGIYDGDGLGVRRGDVVLDCGAHYGVYTRHALKAGARLVVAIEPDPDNLECLRRNLAEEIAQGRVVAYAKGVWDREEWLPLRRESQNTVGHSFVLRRESAAVPARLPLTTIDKLVSELGLARVDFIKMDIEGAERRALAGARATLARFQPRIAAAVYHLPDDPAALPAVVRSANSAYRAQCTFCSDWGYYLRPEVTHFY